MILQRLAADGLVPVVQASKGRQTATRRVVISDFQHAERDPNRVGVSQIITPQPGWGHPVESFGKLSPNGKVVDPNAIVVDPNRNGVAPNAIGPTCITCLSKPLPPDAGARDNPNAVGVRKTGGGGGFEIQNSGKAEDRRRSTTMPLAASGRPDASPPSAAAAESTGWIRQALVAAGATGSDADQVMRRHDLDLALVAYFISRAVECVATVKDGVRETAAKHASRRAGLLRKLFAAERDDLHAWKTFIDRHNHNRVAAAQALFGWASLSKREEMAEVEQWMAQACGEAQPTWVQMQKALPMLDVELWAALRPEKTQAVWLNLVTAIREGRQNP